MHSEHIYSKLLAKLELTPYKLEKTAKLGNGVVGKAIDSNSSISADTADKIVAAFPYVSKLWLLTGDGEMLTGEPPINSIGAKGRVTGEQIRLQKAFGPQRSKGIAAVPIGAQANYSRHFMEPVFEAQLERFFIPGFPYDGDNFRAWQVEGESMTYIKEGREEGLLDREWIITELTTKENWTGVRNWYIYVLVTENLITIKRLFKLNELEFVMIPDNPDYPQEIVDIEDIKELWIFKRKLEWNAAPPRHYEIKVKSKRKPE